MMTDFYDVFGEEENTNRQMPKEVLEELNKKIPRNFQYVQLSSEEYMVVPREDIQNNEIRMITNIDLESEKNQQVISVLKTLPKENWTEYLYRTQKSVVVKNVSIGNSEELMPIEQATANPFWDSQPKFIEGIMTPQAFNITIPFVYETCDGIKMELLFQQQKYDSIHEILYRNINHPELKCDLYLYKPLVEYEDMSSHTSKKQPVCINYSITPTKAESVLDAVQALQIFKAIMEGTIIINGLSTDSSMKKMVDNKEQLQEFIRFWDEILNVEKKLGLNFNPGADFPQDDVYFFEQLNQCINNNKAILWERPFKHFHVGGLNMKNKIDFSRDSKNKEPLSIEFVEGPINATLLGCEFQLFSMTKIDNFVIEKIEWDDDTKQSAEIFITDAPGKVCTLSRLFMPEEDAKKIKLGEKTRGTN